MDYDKYDKPHRAQPSSARMWAVLCVAAVVVFTLGRMSVPTPVATHATVRSVAVESGDDPGEGYSERDDDRATDDGADDDETGTEGDHGTSDVLVPQMASDGAHIVAPVVDTSVKDTDDHNDDGMGGSANGAAPPAQQEMVYSVARLQAAMAKPARKYGDLIGLRAAVQRNDPSVLRAFLLRKPLFGLTGEEAALAVLGTTPWPFGSDDVMHEDPRVFKPVHMCPALEALTVRRAAESATRFIVNGHLPPRVAPRCPAYLLEPPHAAASTAVPMAEYLAPCERDAIDREAGADNMGGPDPCIQWIGDVTSAHAVAMVSSCSYIDRAVDLIRALRRKGNYHRDIVLVYDGNVHNALAKLKERQADRRVVVVRATHLLPEEYVRMPPYPCGGHTDASTYHAKRIKAWRAYYLKLVLFTPFFKQWDRVLYMDTGCSVHRPSINSFFDSIDSTGVLMATPDGWPVLSDVWRLRRQFWPQCDWALYADLASKFDLCQPVLRSTVMLFDTAIIDTDGVPQSTARALAELYHTYGAILLGDQPVISMHFHNRLGVFRPLPYRLAFTDEIPFEFGRDRSVPKKYILTGWHYGDTRPHPTPAEQAARRKRGQAQKRMWAEAQRGRGTRKGAGGAGGAGGGVAKPADDRDRRRWRSGRKLRRGGGDRRQQRGSASAVP